MAQIVDINLTTKGVDTGSFTLTPLDTAGAVVTGTGWPKTAQALTQNVPVRYSDVPDTAFQIKVQSASAACSTFITLRFKS
jgi:hypothetical protein